MAIGSVNHAREVWKMAAERGAWAVAGAVVGAFVLAAVWRPESDGATCSTLLSMSSNGGGWVMTCLDEAGRRFVKAVEIHAIVGPWIIGGFIGLFVGSWIGQAILGPRSEG